MKKLILLFFLLSATEVGRCQSFQWAKAIDTFSTQGKKITCDQNNNIITTGNLTGGPVDFDFGPSFFGLTSGVGNNNAYIAKYNTNGDLIWAKLIFSQNYDNQISDLKVDLNNSIYIIGKFKGTIDFDLGIGVFNLSNNNQNNYEQLFIEKLDSNGNFLWAKKIGDTTGYTLNPSCCLTSAEDIIIIDAFNGLIDFDPNVGVQTMTAITDNSYILKLDGNGQFVWAKQLLGGTNSGVRIISDLSNNLYLIGKFQNTIDADPNLGIYYISGASNNNVFIIKLSSSADFIWARSISTIYVFSSLVVSDIYLDKKENLYYCGYFGDSIDFDSGPSVEIHNSNGATDAYVSKLDSAGNYKWTRTFGSIASDNCRQIIADTSGNSYLMGSYTGTVDFDPSINGVYNLSTLPSGGFTYISKLDSLGIFVHVYSFGSPGNVGGIGGNSIVLDQFEDIFMTGKFYGTHDFDPGAGLFNIASPGLGSFMFIEKFGFCGAYYDTAITHCNTINLWGNNYDSSKQFVQMFSDANECDSNINVNLTIIYGPKDTLNQTECKSFTVNNITYTAPGLYVQNYPIGGACDSLFVINLSLLNPGTINVMQVVDTLHAYPSGYTYQWIDCTTNLPIAGATDSIFVPSVTGSYKAVVYFGANCSDTTGCKVISKGEGVNDFSLTNFSIKPNPTKGHFEIVSKEYRGTLNVKITDIFGNKIFLKEYKPNENLHFDLSKYSSGLYIIELDAEKQNLFYKILKQ